MAFAFPTALSAVWFSSKYRYEKKLWKGLYLVSRYGLRFPVVYTARFGNKCRNAAFETFCIEGISPRLPPLSCNHVSLLVILVVCYPLYLSVCCPLCLLPSPVCYLRRLFKYLFSSLSAILPVCYPRRLLHSLSPSLLIIPPACYPLCLLSSLPVNLSCCYPHGSDPSSQVHLPKADALAVTWDKKIERYLQVQT